ncbi:MAG: hypothetical protein KF691_01840 [Phycisphaeraceae bacterium]|nr:hypothetical protein [Phycisphaeraceae bacterium]
MANRVNLEAILAGATLPNQYARQLARIQKAGNTTAMIEEAVSGVMGKLPGAVGNSLVIYGDPQSGKTELMICLTARLLDDGHHTIIHLVTDSVDLLSQNLDRFKLAGLAPSPRNASDLANAPVAAGHNAVLFCKKNARDLAKLIPAIAQSRPVVVIDDEADYATPNAKINQAEQTKINKLVGQLLGSNGVYIGVTATPARLNLNNTFNNKTESWVRFRPHPTYTGQDVFFPQNANVRYRLTRLEGPGGPDDARRALARFCITVAHLNLGSIAAGKDEGNYSFLVHTSGKTDDHATDRSTIETTMNVLVSRSGKKFEAFVGMLHAEAQGLFPADDPDSLTKYVVVNASRNAFVVLNSKTQRNSTGSNPTVPTCPFTIIIGGNIVSRGVTFPNLLSMFFTRDVKTKLQQDTYIQRARMFGARGGYLSQFELTIPDGLYNDWQRCFAFHRLALESIQRGTGSPVWIGDDRIAIAASSSIDRSTVDFNRGEMSFAQFDCADVPALDEIAERDPRSIETLEALATATNGGVPGFLIEYLRAEVAKAGQSLAIHKASSIENYGTSADQNAIYRAKGFIGRPQLEVQRFPTAVHHVKIFHNGKGRARVFYKNTGTVHFVQNQ